MRKSLVGAFAAIALFSVPLAAKADPQFSYPALFKLQNVTFTDGASASGFWTTSAYGYLASADVSTTAGTITGWTHQSNVSTSVTGATFVFQRVGGGDPLYTTSFTIVLDDPAHTGVNQIDLANSFECVGSYSCGANNSAVPSADIRYFASGDVVVPEPMRAALLFAPAVLVGLVRRRG